MSVILILVVLISGALTLFAFESSDRAQKYKFVAQAEIVEYKTTVNYGLTLGELIDQSGCNINPDIVGRLYAGPDDKTGGDIEGGERFPLHGSGKEQVILAIVRFDHFIPNDLAIQEMTERGLRPATMQELLAFAAAYPDVQKEFPIVALGSVVEDGRPLIPGGQAYIEKVSPVLTTWDVRDHHKHYDARGVGLTSFNVHEYQRENFKKHENEWTDRFLAVRE